MNFYSTCFKSIWFWFFIVFNWRWMFKYRVWANTALQYTQLSSNIYKRTLISTITPIDSLCPIAKGKIAFFIWKSPFHASFPSSFRYDQLLYTTEDAEESWSLKHQTTLSATLRFFSTQDLQKFHMSHFLLWFTLVDFWFLLEWVETHYSISLLWDPFTFWLDSWSLDSLKTLKKSQNSLQEPSESPTSF